MGLGAGINTQANIEIHLNLSKNQAWKKMQTEVKDLKGLLNDLAKTVGIARTSASFSKLQKELDKTKKALADMTSKVEAQDAAQSALNAEMQEAFTIAKQVTYRYGESGRVIGAFAANVDEATGELRGLDQAMAMVSEETKEEAAETKALMRIMEGLQQASSESYREQMNLNRAVKLGADQSSHVNAFRKQQNKLLTEEAKAKRLAAQETARLKRESDKLAKIAVLEAKGIQTRTNAWNKYQNEIKTVQGRISEYERGVDAAFRASFRLKMVGNDLLQASRSIKNAFVSIMDTFGAFEFTLNRAAGALSIWDSNVDKGFIGVKDLQKGILDMSQVLALIPAEEAARAMYFWGSTTGQTVESINDLNNAMTALEPIMKASIMTETGYEDTIKGVYSILSQFYNGAIVKATDVTEQLFYITQKTAAEFPDLINSFKMVGPIAAANNVKFEELVDLFGRLADLGVRGTMAGRAFRQMFIQMIRPSGPAMAAINDLFDTVKDQVAEFGGKSYYELMFPQGQFVGTEKYLRNLALATENLTRAERNGFLAKIATANELPVLTALVNDQIRALKGLSSTTKSAGDIQAEAHRYFEENWNRLANSWKATIGSLERAWEALKIQVGSVLAKAFEPFIKKVGEAITAVRRWAEAPENKNIIEFIGKLGAGIAVVSAFAGAVAIAAGSLLGLGLAIKGFIWVATPFIAKITGIAGVVGLLADSFIRNFDDIQDAVTYALDTIGDALQSNGEYIAGFGEVFTRVMQPVRDIMDALVKVGTDLIRMFADLTARVLEMSKAIPILEAIGTLLGAFVAARVVMAIASMTKGIVALTYGISGLKKVVGVLKAVQLGMAGLAATETAAGIANVATGVTGIRGAVLGLTRAIGPGGLIALVLGAGFLAYEANFGGFGDLIDSITDNFRDLKREIKEVSAEFGSAATDITKVAEKLASPMLGGEITDLTSPTGGFDVDAARSLGFNEDKISELAQKWADVGGGVWAKLAGDLEASWWPSMEAVKQEQLDRYEKRQKAFLEDWRFDTQAINERIANIGPGLSPVTQESYGAMLAKLFQIMPSDGANQIREIVAAEIMVAEAEFGVGLKTYEDLWTKFTTEEGYKAGEIIAMGRDNFLKMFFNQARETERINIGRAEARTRTYQPLIDTIVRLMKGSASDEAVRNALLAPLRGIINGELVEMGGNLSEVYTSLTPEAQAILSDALEYAGTSWGALSEELEEVNPLDALWKSLTEGIIETMEASKYQVFEKSINSIKDELEEIASKLRYTTITGVGPGKSVGEAYRSILEQMLTDGFQLQEGGSETIRSLGEYLDSKGLLTEADKALMIKVFEGAGEETAKIVNKSWGELVDEFTAGLDVGKGLRKAIESALARGSNASQIRKIEQALLSPWLKKGLRGNAQSRKLALEAIRTRSQGILSGLQQASAKELPILMTKTANWIKNNWDKLPKAAQVNLGPAIDFLLGGKSTLTEKQKKNLRRKLFGAVKDAMVGPDITKGLMGAPSQGQTSLSIPLSVTPSVAMSTVPQEEMQEKVNTAVTVPMQNAINQVNVDATTPALNTVATMNSDAVKGAALTAGDMVGRMFVKGVQFGVYSALDGLEGGVNVAQAATRVKVRMGSVGWYKGGYAAGTSWANGLNQAVINNIDKTLTFTASVLIGSSPPSKGPLSKIDKGGFNVGTAWGKNLSIGAEREAMAGVRNIHRKLSSRNAGVGGLQMKTDVSHKKQIDININVKNAGGTADRELSSQMRKGVYDALVDTGILSHMVTVG